MPRESLFIPLYQMRAPKALASVQLQLHPVWPQVLLAIAWNLDSLRVSWAEALLLQWSELEETRWQVVELFAGQGELSRAFRLDGRRRVVSYDRDMGGGPGGPMDFEKPAGFLSWPRLWVNWKGPRVALWLVMCAGGALRRFSNAP